MARPGFEPTGKPKKYKDSEWFESNRSDKQSKKKLKKAREFKKLNKELNND